MKRFAAYCIAMLILTAAALPALAAQPERGPVIRDDAGLLSEEQRETLRKTMEPLCTYGTPMFWTTAEAGTPAVLAERFYHQQIGTKDGVLFLIDTHEREIYIFRDGGMQNRLSVRDCLAVTDNVYTYAGSGYYAECAAEAFTQIHALLRGSEIARPMQVISCALLALSLALLITHLAFRKKGGQQTEVRWKNNRMLPAVPFSADNGTADFHIERKDMESTLIRRVYRDSDSDSSSGGSRSSGGGGGGGGSHSGGGGGHRF